MVGGDNLPDEYITVKKASEMTGYSISQLRRFDNSGQVKAERLTRGEYEYRVYSQIDVDMLKAMKRNEKLFEIQLLETQLGDLLQDFFSIELNDNLVIGYRSISHKVDKDNKTISIEIKYQDSECREAVRDLYLRKVRGGDAK